MKSFLREMGKIALFAVCGLCIWFVYNTWMQHWSAEARLLTIGGVIVLAINAVLTEIKDKIDMLQSSVDDLTCRQNGGRLDDLP